MTLTGLLFEGDRGTSLAKSIVLDLDSTLLFSLTELSACKSGSNEAANKIVSSKSSSSLSTIGVFLVTNESVFCLILLEKKADGLLDQISYVSTLDFLLD